jgi:hypothetical protein
VNKRFSLNKILAIRRVRAGETIDRASHALSVRPDVLSALDAACRSVPDDVLAHMEHVLRDNEKLRRLVADLLPTLRGD